MIEAGATPVVIVVTIGAFNAELAVVVIVFLVTAVARGLGLAPGLASLVATGAIERAMRAGQRKIGVGVIKAGAIQADNVALTPLMLGMTSHALAGAGVGHAPVIATLAADVGAITLWQSRQSALWRTRSVRSWQLLHTSSSLAWPVTTGPGMSSVSTDVACAAGAPARPAANINLTNQRPPAFIALSSL